jgi:CubicO group peptidase (beta-lactamase class C family)
MRKYLRGDSLLALLATALAAGCVRPATSPPVPARSALGARIDTILSRYAMYGMSGSVAVEENGRVILEHGYGFADRDRRIAATASTTYDVGSIVKTFTAAAILTLANEGRLNLTDSLGRFFPQGGPPQQAVTIHELLLHTGGFALDPVNAGILEEDSRDVFVTKAMSYALGPRGRYSYSNLGYGLLAIIVEQIAGEDFRAFVNRRLIAPVGLSRTGWWRDSGAVNAPGVATGYVFSDREDVLSAEPILNRKSSASPLWSKWPMGAGGMISNVSDLRLWYHALADAKVIPPGQRDSMFSRLDTTGSQGYSWTIGTVAGLGRRQYKGGSRTGFNALISAYPERGALFVYTTNQSVEAQWHALIWRSLERALRGDSVELPLPTVQPSASALDAFAGVFELPNGGRIRIAREGEEILMGGENQAGSDALLGAAGAPDAERVSDLSRRLVASVLAGRSDTTLPVTWDQLRELTEWIRARAGSGNQLTVLGSVPHTSGAGRVQTFVRAGNPGAPVMRFIWDRTQLLFWADGIRFPAFRRLRPNSASTATAFTPRETGWVTLVRSGDTVRVQWKDGRSTRVARRVP